MSYASSSENIPRTNPQITDRATGCSSRRDLPAAHFNNLACSSDPPRIPSVLHLYLLHRQYTRPSLKPAALLTDQLGAGRAPEH